MYTAIFLLVSVMVLVVISRVYKKVVKNSICSDMTEETKRSLGQVTGFSDASKTMAHHGLVVDEVTGRYYSQHRHCDAVLLNQ